MIGAPFALVLSGVTRAAGPARLTPRPPRSNLTWPLSWRPIWADDRGLLPALANFCKHPGVGVACSMAGDDPFRRYQEVDAEFVEATRARADEFLRQLAQMGGSTQRQAQDAGSTTWSRAAASKQGRS